MYGNEDDEINLDDIDPEIIEAAKEMGLNKEQIVQLQKQLEQEGYLENEEEDPLEAYVHNHEDPEASTLFAKSLKSKLKQAMAEMWDAELYLRLYQPEKSLPYQYKALKLIQEIKNSARIYVHRIGFDPPPIKESSRLTGDIDEVKSLSKNETLTNEELYPSMREAVARLEVLSTAKEKIQPYDKALFERAGNELGVLAIQEPSKHLKTLQDLKRLVEAEQATAQELKKVMKGLISAIPAKESSPNPRSGILSQMDELLLQEIGKNE